MSCRYIIRQEVFGGYNKIIAIRPTRESARSLIEYLQKVDAKNVYYYHSDTDPRSDTRS
jgi:hypothetical protein